MAEPAVAAAWHPDPNEPGQLRWWDGSAWTEHTAPDPTANESAPVLTAVPVPTPVPVPTSTSVPVPVPAAAPALTVAALPSSPSHSPSSSSPEAPAPAEESSPTVIRPPEWDEPRVRTAPPQTNRPRLAVMSVAAVVVIVVAVVILKGGGEEPGAASKKGTRTPAAATGTSSTAGGPGSAVPSEIDARYGNGASKARDTAAQMQQQLSAEAQVAADDPSAMGAGG